MVLKAMTGQAGERETMKWFWTIALLLCFVTREQAAAQDAGAFYQQNCAACHTIGGGELLGPDLRNVEARKDRKWLAEFLIDPQATLGRGDLYGKKLLAASGGMVMPTVGGIDRARAEALLDWIAAQSGAAGTAAPAQAEPEAPFTPADAARGRSIVLGSQSLANNGSPCIACHSFRGLPSLGGGALGPNLTSEFTHLGGRKGVTAWLSAPATPTMQSAYKTHPLKPEEILALAAYLESLTASNAPAEAGGSGRSRFLALGLGGCVIGLLLMDALWKKRFSAVRRPLVLGKNLLAKRGSR